MLLIETINKKKEKEKDMDTLEVVEINALYEIKEKAYQGFFRIPGCVVAACYCLTFLKEQPSPENPNVMEVLSETTHIYLDPGYNIKVLEDYAKNKVFQIKDARYSLLETSRLF